MQTLIGPESKDILLRQGTFTFSILIYIYMLPTFTLFVVLQWLD